MYCTVPTMVPCVVSGESCGLGVFNVTAADSSGAELDAIAADALGAANAFASPKSSSTFSGGYDLTILQLSSKKKDLILEISKHPRNYLKNTSIILQESKTK